MYELKTLLPQFEIKLPTCMYELKNISLSGVGAAGPVVSVLKLLAAVAKTRDERSCDQTFPVTAVAITLFSVALAQIKTCKIHYK